LNRFIPSPRRMLAIAGAAFVGAAAALAFASPASAHHTAVEGAPVCDTETGEWVVAWTVRSQDTPPRATQFKLVEIEADPDTAIEWATDPGVFQSIDDPFVGEQRLPGDATEATLAVRGAWNNGFEEEKRRKGKVPLEGPCEQPPGESAPSAEFTTSCEGDVTVLLTNGDEATAPATLTVTGTDGLSEERTLQPGEDDTVDVPAANAGEVTVTEGDTVVATGKRDVPANCGGLPVTGANVAAAAGTAGGLVAIGAVLFLVARRRRIQFTA
jgi:hypothetical protein